MWRCVSRSRRTTAGRSCVPGLSVRAVIDHGPGDPGSAEQAARQMADVETPFQSGQRVTVRHDVSASLPRPSNGADPAVAGNGPGWRPSPSSPSWPRSTRRSSYRRDGRRDPHGHRGRTLRHDLDQRLLGSRNLLRGLRRHLGHGPLRRADTLLVGLAWFAVGNLLCGAAADVPTLAAAKLVEGIGKGAGDRALPLVALPAVRPHGHRGHRLLWRVAYATRPTTPLVTALINDALSWRWIFWVNVPLGLLAFPLVRRFIKPDRPAEAAAAADRLGGGHRCLRAGPSVLCSPSAGIANGAAGPPMPLRRRPCLPWSCPLFLCFASRPAWR